jgi:UPF0716 protein FxsA
MRLWFLVFFATPIVEMYLLIEVGGYIGAIPTIALVVLTAMAGVALLRVQGLATLGRGLGRLQGGQLPAQEVVEGLLLAFAGALLITPGFITDVIGFLLLTPAFRAGLARRLMSRAFLTGVVGSVRPGERTGASGVDEEGGDRGPIVIEGDFESRTDERPPAGDRRDRNDRE